MTLLEGNVSLSQATPARSVPIGVDSFVSRFARVPEGSELHSLQRVDNGYRYRERTVIPGVMRREVTVELDDSLHVRRAESSGVLGDRPIMSSVVYDRHHARGSTTPLQARTTTPVRIDTVLPAAAFDGFALYPVLLSRPWKVGVADTLLLFDTDELSVTRQTARATAREKVVFPAETIDALRIELSTTQLPVTLWVTEKAPHRLLKIASANGETIRVSR
jgi:hypothetical protein